MCWELNWWCLMIISRFFFFYLWCYLLSSAVTHNRLQKHYTIHEDSCILFGIVVCLCKKKKKISDVTVMQFCQVPVFNFYSVGHRCFLSISSPLSNVGSRRWILNLSGWDPGTHTHTKKRKKLFTFMSRNKETRNKHPRMCQCCRCTHQTFKGFSCRSSVCPVVILKGVTLSELYI